MGDTFLLSTVNSEIFTRALLLFKINRSRNGKTTLSFIDVGKSCLNGIFNVANMSFNAIRENKILSKIFEFTVILLLLYLEVKLIYTK